MIGVSLSVFFLIAGASAPIPKHLMKASPYYPTKVGTTWVYTVTGDEEMELTETISSIVDGEDGRTLTLRVSHTEVAMGIRMTTTLKMERRVNQNGLYALEPWPETPGSIRCLIKFPPKSGIKWEDQGPINNTKIICKILDAERIKVSAGEYLADRVEIGYITDRKKEYRVGEAWYAPGVGLVKQQRSDINRVQTLKSFTLGKD